MARPKTITCESTNHRTHQIAPKSAWKCEICKGIFCALEGCDDDMPNACDSCWDATPLSNNRRASTGIGVT